MKSFQSPSCIYIIYSLYTVVQTVQRRGHVVLLISKILPLGELSSKFWIPGAVVRTSFRRHPHGVVQAAFPVASCKAPHHGNRSPRLRPHIRPLQWHSSSGGRDSATSPQIQKCFKQFWVRVCAPIMPLASSPMI